MAETFHFTIDGRQIAATANDTIMKAADKAGVYIPRLCDVEGLTPQGSCRVCTVKMNGKSVSACTQPAVQDSKVDNETLEIKNWRKDLVKMLFQEGNHICPTCEASGRCELQAMGYRLGITQPSKYPYLQPVRPVDASHPDIIIDSNRCIFCARCVRASKDVDKKNIVGYVGRGINKRIGVNADNLAATNADINDLAFAVETCPVGCIIQKRAGFFAPINARQFDNAPIGSNIEHSHDDDGEQ